MENSEKLTSFTDSPVGPVVFQELINPGILRGSSGPSAPQVEKVMDFDLPKAL